MKGRHLNVESWLESMVIAFPIEVDCIGFVGKSVWRMCSEIGIIVTNYVVRGCCVAAHCCVLLCNSF
jgi:hypothetical protein